MDAKSQMKMQTALKYLKECWRLFLQRLNRKNTMLIKSRTRSLLNRLASTFKDIFEDIKLGYLSPKERFVLVGIVSFITIFLAASAL